MMKKHLQGVCALILTASMLVGCSGVKPVSKNEDIDKENTLTISTYFPDPYLEDVAKAFEKEHPNVSVKIKSFKELGEDVQVGEGQVAPGEDLNPNNTLENYVTYLNTAFMSGNAEDMISLSWLPINKYVESGYLLDLTDRIEADSDLTNENYYMNVLKANTYNDIIYSIPMAFGFNMIGINGNVLEKTGLSESKLQEECWNFDSMKQLIEAIPDREEKEIYLQHGNGLNLFAWIFQLESNEFINLETKTVNLNSEKFIGLLEECKAMEEKKILYAGDQENQYALFSGLMSERYVLYQPKYIDYNEECSYVKPLINQKGEIAMGSSNEIAITKDAKNKELCWEFIKFMLSEEGQKSPELYGYAVNRKVATMKNEQEIKKFEKELKRQRIALKVPREEILSDLEKNIDKWSNMPFISYDINEIRDTIDKEVKIFFEGQKSAKEVAAVLQNKINIMVNE